MSASNDRVRYSQLFRFFIPLALTPMMIGMSHTIINAALARLPAPAMSIAVFTVVKGLSHIIKSPILMSRQVITSLVDDRKSYHLAMKFLWVICGLFLCLLFLLGYTPLGGWVLRNIIGLKGTEQIAFAYLALRIICFLPIVEFVRNSHQGLAIGLERTKLVVPGIVLRLLVISAFLWWTVRTQAVLGIVAGSISWLAGIGIESVFIVLYLILHYNSPGRAAEKMPSHNSDELEVSGVVKFFFPLGLMMSLTAMLQPVIQSGIARSQSPTQSLAAYGVAWTLVLIMVGPVAMLHQCSLMYAGDNRSANWKRVLTFCLLTGIIISGVIFAVALSPLGYWIFHNVIAVSEEITEIARRALLVFAIFPLIRSYREAYWGMLMRQQTTTAIGMAKAVNLIAVVTVLIVGFGLMTVRVLEPAVIGALAFIIGEGVETLVIRNYTVKKIRLKQGLRSSRL